MDSIKKRKKTDATGGIKKRKKTDATDGIKVGIIGGTGLNNPDILTERREKKISTAYGEPSDSLVCGKIGSVDCVLLARHNKEHGVSPSFVNYRANVLALKEEGCTHLVVTTACGSLQEHIHPGEMVIPDQFIDRTYRRESSFYDGKEGHMKGVCHIAMGEPFCQPLRELLVETVQSLNIPCHHKGTVVTIEGPRFSTRSESKLFKSWGADIINMTTVPEVALANEVGLPYAAIAMATDYDSWKDDENYHVDVELIKKTLKKNSENAVKILRAFIPRLAATDWQPTVKSWREKAEKAIYA